VIDLTVIELYFLYDFSLTECC